jgi:serine protease Do
MRDLPRLVAATPVNENVKMQILRDGKTREIRLAIGKMAEDESGDVKQAVEGSSWDKFGMVLKEIDGGTAQQFGLEPGTGLLITEVNQDGPAAEAGLLRGDIIVEANGKQTNDLPSFQAAAEKAAKTGVLRLLIKRQDNLLYVALKMK